MNFSLNSLERLEFRVLGIYMGYRLSSLKGLYTELYKGVL